MIKSMSVQQLIEFLHHDSTPSLLTADERKQAFQTDTSLDHLQLVKVIFVDYIGNDQANFLKQHGHRHLHLLDGPFRVRGTPMLG